MTPRPIDPAAAADRVAFLERKIADLRNRIVDARADIAWHQEQIAWERAQIAQTPPAREAPGAVKGAGRSTGASKPKRRPRAIGGPA